MAAQELLGPSGPCNVGRITKTCFAAAWRSLCGTEFWRELWQNSELQVKARATDVQQIAVLVSSEERCRLEGERQQLCMHAGMWLESQSVPLQQGLFPDKTMTPHEQFELLDMLDVSKIACPVYHTALRMLLQVMPQAFTNKTRQGMVRRGLHRGVDAAPLSIVLDRLLAAEWPSQVPERAVLSMMALWAEQPLAMFLFRPFSGPPRDTVAECIDLAFRPPKCHGKPMLNTSLLAAFHTQRSPGLKPSLVARLLASEQHLERVTGRLAEADRLRNLGADPRGFLEVFKPALEDLKVVMSTEGMAAILPSYWDIWGWKSGSLPSEVNIGILWHLLDKLSLPNVVRLAVEPPPKPDSQRGRFWISTPAVSHLDMYVLPGHDIVSDSVRTRQRFHCPRRFRTLLAIGVAEKAPSEAALRVVDVGGYLGDCLLWAAAWLGPHFRGLEVEAQALAAARMAASLKAGSLEDSVVILGEPAGSGELVDLIQTQSPNSDFNAVEQQSTHRKERRVRARPLDEMLQEWPALSATAAIDLVRIKTCCCDESVLTGLSHHLKQHRIRRLLLESGRDLEKVKALMLHFPDYEDVTSEELSSEQGTLTRHVAYRFREASRLP